MKDNFNLKQWISGKERMLNTLPENPDIPKKFVSEDDGYPKNLNESHGKATSISQLDPGDKFTFKGEEYTFIAHIEGEPNQARVILPSGEPSVVSFGGPINTDLEGGTSMADMGLGKGHYIDEEEDRDEELIAKLTPVSQVIDEEDYDADQAQKDDEEDEERGYDDDGLPLGEGKGQMIADKYVAQLREKVFKKLTDDELDEFKATLKKSLDL